MLGGQRGAGARAVVHQQGLSQDLADLVGHDARHRIGAAAGRKSHDQRDGPRGIGLGHRATGQSGQQQRQCKTLEHGLSPVY